MLSFIINLGRVWEWAPVRPILILTYPGDRDERRGSPALTERI